MRNYYDDLEINKNASQEVIEKVYKVLAKKYHPDTTQEPDKQLAEEKFKMISEAYETLSNEEKRKKYDMELSQNNPSISYEQYISVIRERDALNNALNNMQNEYNQFKNYINTNLQYRQNNTQQQQYNQYQQTNYIPKDENVSYNTQNNSNLNYANNPYKKRYYYTSTGKPASAFDYFKYRIREFFSNILFTFLLILVFIFIINFFLSTNIFRLFIK